MSRSYLFASVAFAGLVLTGGAQAATLVSYTTSLPPDVFTAPDGVPVNTLFPVGSVTNVFASPFSDNTSVYVSVEDHGSATYNLSGNTLTLVLGSPDTYNLISFLDSKGATIDSFTPSDPPLSRLLNYFVTIRAKAEFAAVQFTSTVNALEFSNVKVTTVPLPASAPLFGGALVALGVVGYGMKRKGKVSA